MHLNRNAYFQISSKSDGMYITLYPPMSGGEKLTFPEVKNYLNSREILFDETALLESLNKSEIKEIMLGSTDVSSLNEDVLITVSGNRMTAVGRFYPASADGKQLSWEDILKRLSGMGVSYGVMKDAVSEWLQNRQYCTDIILAKGTEPEASRDAVIEYKFTEDKNARPALKDDGSVDFHQLDILNNVTENDVLAVKTPEYKGKRGITVLGTDVPSEKPVSVNLKYGKNVEISEDGCVLTAKCSGHVNLEKDRVTVHNIYTVSGDVGVSTGNINYNGSVKISGDVTVGYSVKAAGNVFVDGVVEGADLNAGGKIAVGLGIHGGSKGSIIAGGDVSTKFIEESLVKTDGKVFSGSILHSKVSARDNIIVTTGKGVIIGGELKTSTFISANVVGSARTCVDTLLEIGADSAVLEKFDDVRKALGEMRGELKKLRQAQALIKNKTADDGTLSPDQAKLKDALSAHKSFLESEIKSMTKEYLQLKAEIEKSDSGRVVINGSVHEGTRIMISNVSYYVRDSMRRCQFVKDGFEIKVVT